MEKTKSWFKVLLVLAVVCAVFGMALIGAGFIVPPLGVIDTSVLTMWGETLTFVGYCLGIDYNYKFKEKIARLNKKED